MGDDWRIFIALAAAALLLATSVVLWHRRKAVQRQVDCERAMREFAERRTELAAEFLPAAAAGGKPRGLWWKSCEFTGAPLFAYDDASRTLYALIGVTVSFEAVAGGGMEEVEAVGNLRSATAVFGYRGGQWTTEGRVIFNLEPAEALSHFQSTLRRVC